MKIMDLEFIPVYTKFTSILEPGEFNLVNYKEEAALSLFIIYFKNTVLPYRA